MNVKQLRRHENSIFILSPIYAALCKWLTETEPVSAKKIPKNNWSNFVYNLVILLLPCWTFLTIVNILFLFQLLFFHGVSLERLRGQKILMRNESICKLWCTQQRFVNCYLQTSKLHFFSAIPFSCCASAESREREINISISREH